MKKQLKREIQILFTFAQPVFALSGRICAIVGVQLYKL